MSSVRAMQADWLAAGLCLSRTRAPDADVTAVGLRWLGATLAELGALPPPGVVLDIAHMLVGGALDTHLGLAVVDPPLRRAIARYEDRLLGRLAADPRLIAMRDALPRLTDEQRVKAVGVVVAHLCADSEGLAAVEAGQLRKLARIPAADVITAGFSAWRGSRGVLSELARGYDALADLAAGRRALVSDALVFTLENFAALGELGQRVAIAQVVNAAEELARSWPRRIRMTRTDHGPAPTSLEDESAFPAGGFTSVANHGAFENLVASELVYMERGDQEADVDLFDVRYAEGELLFYTRDEAMIVRPRRVIAFVLSETLERARVLDPGQRFQRLVAMMGWVLATVRCTARWLGETELSFLCVMERGTGSTDVLAHEAELLTLLLAEWVDKGMAELTWLTRPEWEARLSLEARTADTRSVLLCGDEESAKVREANAQPQAPWVQLHFAAKERDWPSFCAEGLSLLRLLV